MAKTAKTQTGRRKPPTPRPVDRHHGGQEPPDELQDRPEQNKGYDEAVRSGGRGTQVEPRDDAEVVDLETGVRDVSLRIESEDEEQ